MAYRDDLSAAMARAEAAERALAGVCVIHTSEPSSAECSTCKRTFCEACVMTTEQAAILCTTCYVAYTARRRRRQLMLVAAGLTVAGGAAFGFAQMGRKRTEEMVRALPLPSAVERPRYSKMPNRIRLLREAIAADPCNRDAALELARLLNENLAYPETIEANDRFLGKCGPFPQLVWTSVYAHEQRGEWSAAVKLSSALIAEEPGDADFWWWRGQDRTELGQLAEAAADYRQSMALGGQRFAAFRFAAVAEKMKDFCEAAFAIRYRATIDDGGQMGDSWDRFKQLYTAGACDDLTGHGKAVIPFKPEVPLVTAKLAIHAKTASVVVDSSAGHLILSRDFAGKMAMAHGTRVQAYVMGELRDAWTAVVSKVELDGAVATDVHALVVESLPPGLDGVVGLSFLWRFGVERNDERGEITLTGWGE